MTIASRRAAAPAAPDGLSIARTVDRTTLHRHALSEVFLTDIRAVDTSSYIAAAQLPPLHAYYTDHLLRWNVPDALLLLECARQAETYGGHAFFEVDDETAFILKRWEFGFDGLPDILLGDQPGTVTLTARTRSPKRSASKLRGLTYDMDVAVDGRDVGAVSMDVGYLPKSVHREMRAARRGSPPVWSDDAGVVTPGQPVAPHLVGRSLSINVVLADADARLDRVTAVLRPPVRHPSMFDHPQDHVPGMVLTEAARQLSVLALGAWHAVAPMGLMLVAVEAEFHAYAELDRVTSVTALEAGHVGRDFSVTVDFEQGDLLLARMRLRLVTAPPALYTTAATRLEIGW
jgi:A-factor biosynthesis hotdog domain